MKATCIHADSTRIVPVQPANKASEVTRNADGSMAVKFGDGREGVLPVEDRDLQAFILWTMLNNQV